jgi:hypothetical protein
MQPRDQILERFERNVDVPSYLAQRGYRPSSSSAYGIAMENPVTGDLVLLKQGLEGGAWTYANPRDQEDRGSIADFMVRRDGVSLETCTARIVALSTIRSRDPEAVRYRTTVASPPPELVQAKAAHLQGLEAEKTAAQVLRNLGIAAATFDEWRFGALRTPEAVAGIMTDPPGLWVSKYRPTDRALVFTEQVVDAIAYELEHGKQMACYVAIGRRPGDEVKKKIAHVLCEVPRGVTVVLAFGADDRGRQVADEVRALAPTLRMERRPPDFGTRWSNKMQLEHRHVRSVAHPGPSLGR